MISQVKLTDFRNFKNKSIKFSDKITVIVGPNAAGKTNILEALYLLSTGKSFKAGIEAEMINYNKDIARVDGILTRHPSLEVVLTRGLIDIGADRPERVPRKKLLVDGVSKRMVDFAGNFKVVFFGPQDLDLVTESPSIRRKFLDSVLSQVDREYRRCILSYEKGVRQRNRLLFRIREEQVPRSQLLFWNQLLIKNGNYVTLKREEFIAFANNANEHQLKINTDYQLDYDKSVISEGRLEQYKDEEVAAATTLVGPHRDDFTFAIKSERQEVKERNLEAYGSRGEQRMGVLWLKMKELDYIENTARFSHDSGGVRPTLLLDDIFSELDHKHREIVMNLAKKQQTVITTADEHYLKGLKADDIIELRNADR